MESNFTLTSGNVDGFKSTWQTEGQEKPVESVGVATETIETVSCGTNCEEYASSVSVNSMFFL